MSERPTPQSIAVCTLISIYSDRSSPFNQALAAKEAQDVERQETSARSTLNSILEQAVTLEWKEGGSTLSLRRWVDGIKRKRTGNSLEVDFLKMLYESLDQAVASIEGLIDFMSFIQSNTARGIVDPVSAHGVYIRQVSLGFDELSFESVTILWQALREELEEWATAPSENMSAAGYLASSDYSDRAASTWSTSREQVERMVRQECLSLISDIDGVDSTTSTNSTFEATEVRIKSFLDNDPEIPLLYFWRYVNCLRYGEKSGAIDSLHAYLDHAMMAHSDILQFSALLLASTHASFGDWHVAEMAVQEAVKVAQQSKDAACVAFALGWLSILHRKTKSARSSSRSSSSEIFMEGEMLERCATRAMQGNLRPLQSGANMLLARYCLQSSESSSLLHDGTSFDDPASTTGAAWTNLLNAMTTTPPAQSSTGANGARNAATAPVTSNDILPRSFDKPTAFSAGYNGEQAMKDLAQQRLVSAGMWDALGNPILSGVSSLATVECHDHLSLNDTIVAIQNVGRSVLHGCAFDKLGAKGGFAPLPGQHLGEECVYATAIRTILDLRERYMVNASSRSSGNTKPASEEKSNEGSNDDDDAALEEPFFRSALLILHEWAVRRGELNDADALQIILPDFLYPRMGASYDAYLHDIKLQQVHVLTKRGRWDDARAILETMIEEASNEGSNKQQQAGLILQFAALQLEASSTGMAALEHILKALTLSKDDEMDGIHATAVSLLARLFLKMGHAKRSLALLKSCIGLLMQHAHIFYQAEAMLTYAMCYMQMCNEKNDKWMEVLAERTKKPTKTQIERDQLNALSYLKRAQSLFQRCHDVWKLKHVFYLQARLCHDMGPAKHGQRDAASERFVACSQYLDRSIGDKAGSQSPYILDNLKLNEMQHMLSRDLPFIP